MVVSDSTTLIILLDLDRLDLLSNLFSKVVIPKAVYNEITFKKNFKLPNFIKIKDAQNIELIKRLQMLLDKGESEAIALAFEMDKKLIIDEKKGRKIALNYSIKIIGLLGIIYLNIKRGFISKQEAREFLNLAINRGYRINQNLIDEMFDGV